MIDIERENEHIKEIVEDYEPLPELATSERMLLNKMKKKGVRFAKAMRVIKHIRNRRKQYYKSRFSMVLTGLILGLLGAFLIGMPTAPYQFIPWVIMGTGFGVALIGFYQVVISRIRLRKSILEDLSLLY